MARSRFSFLALPMLNLASLVLFHSLDVYDLWAKASWLGPAETFTFGADHTGTVDSQPLERMINNATDGVDTIQKTTGWTSLLSRCEALYAVSGRNATEFHTVWAVNCEMGIASNAYTASEVIMSASVRVDAIAWASCKMLLMQYRPSICQESMVTDFAHRYRFVDAELPLELRAHANSDAEKELVQMLEVISRSWPRSQVVCMQGFQPNGPGIYTPSLFACAAPNLQKSAFVGFHAFQFAEVLGPQAWLSVDSLRVMGLELVVRQNSESTFTLRPTDSEPENVEELGMTVSEHTRINFSSFGHLFVVLVVVDLWLLVTHAQSAIETFKALAVPSRRSIEISASTNNEAQAAMVDAALAARKWSWMVLYHSLYRSNVVVVLTMLSGVLSWWLSMPNAILWIWDDNATWSAHAFLTSMRVWMLTTCVLNLLWDLLVYVNEDRAYVLAKRTFVSMVEILMVTGFVALVEQPRTFRRMALAKYELEGQRSWDVDSFVGRTAMANAFHEELDLLLSTPHDVLSVVFSPLQRVILESLGVLVLYLAVKRFAYGIMMPQTLEEAATTLMDGDNSSSKSCASSIAIYQRLPIEELVQMPMRARSLVRSSLTMEQELQGDLCVLPQVYYDFGVRLQSSSIRTRRHGFMNVIHVRLDVGKLFRPTAAAGSLAPSSTLVAAASSPNLSTQTASKTTALLLATDDCSRNAAKNQATSPRPLGVATGSPHARSMRRRKSINDISTTLT